MFFSEPARLLELHNAMNKSSYTGAYFQNNNGEAPFCEPFLELKVLVININECYNEDIKRSCKTLSDYQTYVFLVQAYSETMPIEKAVSTAIEECIGNNVLREFLKKERAVIGWIVWRMCRK